MPIFCFSAKLKAMKTWQFLKENDVVDVVAPGSGTSPQELEAALEFLRKQKLHPRVSENLFSGHPYLSNNDQFRSKDIKRAILAKDSKLIWCLRGGYGAIRLIPELMKMKKPQQKKLLIGYSDVSTLHVFLNQKWGWTTCHGPLLDALGKQKQNEKDVRELMNLLRGDQTELVFDQIEALNSQAKKIKNINSKILAGNLVTLLSTLGGPCELRARAKILVLEEIGERGYRIDRLFNQLLQSKALGGVKAVILGDFLGGNEPDGKNFVQESVNDFASKADKFRIPVFKNIQVGHGQINRPLFLGPRAALTRKADSFQLLLNSGGQY